MTECPRNKIAVTCQVAVLFIGCSHKSGYFPCYAWFFCNYCFHILLHFSAFGLCRCFGLFLLFLLLFIFRCLLSGLQRLVDIFGRFVGLALRIDRSLRFMGFGWLHSFFILIWKLKASFSGVFVERDVTVVRLPFLINQPCHIYGLTRFEILVLIIGQFLATKCFWSFLWLALLIILLVVLLLSVVVTAVKQKFGIAFIGIVLYRCRKLRSFCGNHTL